MVILFFFLTFMVLLFISNIYGSTVFFLTFMVLLFFFLTFMVRLFFFLFKINWYQSKILFKSHPLWVTLYTKTDFKQQQPLKKCLIPVSSCCLYKAPWVTCKVKSFYEIAWKSSTYKIIFKGSVREKWKGV